MMSQTFWMSLQHNKQSVLLSLHLTQYDGLSLPELSPPAVPLPLTVKGWLLPRLCRTPHVLLQLTPVPSWGSPATFFRPAQWFSAQKATSGQVKHFADVGKMVVVGKLINKSNSSVSLQFFLKTVIKKKKKEKFWGLYILFTGFKTLNKDEKAKWNITLHVNCSIHQSCYEKEWDWDVTPKPVL